MTTTLLPNGSAAAGSSPPAEESLRLAAVDVGSNSIHMVIAQADTDGAITTLWRVKEAVGLGRMSFPSHKLSDQAMDAGIAALGRIVQAARQRQCEKIMAVATSAIREATNGGDFIRRASRELDLDVRVVSAEEEARLIYLAVRHAMPLGNDPHLIIDIGGGSVEFIVGNQSTTQLLQSRKLGAARMTARYITSDPVSVTDRDALLAHYDQVLEPLCQRIQKLHPVRVIGTSGTIENIAAMLNLPQGGIEREPLAQLAEKLLKSDSKARGTIRGLDDQRRDQIIAGTVLVDQVFKRLDLKRLDLCPMALREGILLDWFSRHVPDMQIRREVADPRRRSVIDLGRRCHWNRPHSMQVAHLATRLFDELKPLHALGDAQRELIEYGALLHDIGMHIGRSGHHKHSMYLILNGDLKNFTPEEIRVIACIARYHRKRPPRKRHRRLLLLSSESRWIVQVGTALLRIADGLDRSHSQAVNDVHCTVTPDRVTCEVESRSDAELEVWEARRKSEYFETLFRRRIDVKLK